MNNKAKIIVLAIIPLLIIGWMLACELKNSESEIKDNDAEIKGDEYFYNNSTGEVHKELSSTFDIKIEKWKHYYDEESAQNRILLSIAFKNKTGKNIDDFIGVLKINEDAAPLIASGIITYDRNEPYSLIPNETANGISYSYRLLIEKDEWLEEIKADKDELFEKSRYVTFELSWDGGNEIVSLVLDKLDYDSAPEMAVEGN